MNNQRLKDFISDLYIRWPSLKIALEHHGQFNYLEFVDWLSSVTIELLVDNSDIEASDVQDYLSQTIDNEIDTIIEDGTLEQVSLDVIAIYGLFKQHKIDEIQAKLNSIPSQDIKIAITNTTEADSHLTDSESEEDAYETMETDGEGVKLDTACTPINLQSLQSNSIENSSVQSPPDNDGWHIVTRHKKHDC